MKKFLNIFDKHYPAAFWALMGLMLAMLVSSLLTGCGSTSHFRVSAQTRRPDPGTQKVGKSVSYGTGFFVNRTGLALTAAHIFRGRVPQTERAYAWWAGTDTGLSAKPVVIDWNMDLALVQVATTSKPVKPLCTEVVSGNTAVAFGAPEHMVLRKRGVIFGVYVENTPCATREEESGTSARCANEKPFIYTSDTNLNQSSPSTAPAAIIEATTNIRSGFSGGSILHKDGKKACTAGVIIQQYETGHPRARAIHPGSSPSITRYLLEHAPKFMENFTN